MAKIRSKTKLKYDKRDQTKSAIIELEIINFNLNLKTNRFIIEVVDYALIELDSAEIEDNTAQSIPNIPNPIVGDDGGDLTPGKSVYEKPINILNRKYAEVEINALFTAVGEPIEAQDNFSKKLKDLITKALLQTTIDKPIYGSLGSDWEIV